MFAAIDGRQPLDAAPERLSRNSVGTERAASTGAKAGERKVRLRAKRQDIGQPPALPKLLSAWKSPGNPLCLRARPPMMSSSYNYLGSRLIIPGCRAIPSRPCLFVAAVSPPDGAARSGFCPCRFQPRSSNHVARTIWMKPLSSVFSVYRPPRERHFACARTRPTLIGLRRSRSATRFAFSLICSMLPPSSSSLVR